MSRRAIPTSFLFGAVCVWVPLPMTGAPPTAGSSPTTDSFPTTGFSGEPCTGLGATGATDTAGHSRPGGTELQKVFDQWIRMYRRGRIDMRQGGRQYVPKVIHKSEALAKKVSRYMSPVQELAILLKAAEDEGSAGAVLRVLQVAGTGLDRFRYTYEHATSKVRDMGERSLTSFRSAEAKKMMLRAAAGERLTTRGTEDAVRSAALRAIGSLKVDGARAALQNGLGARETLVRLAACDGLRRLGEKDTAELLIKLLERETKEPVVIAGVNALRTVFEKHYAGSQHPVLNLGVKTVVAALGRASWRADMTLVTFLDRFRAKDTIPKLIDLLELYVKRPEWVDSGKLSGLLRTRVHEVLVSITGALYPVDRPDQWREHWDREKDNLVIVPPKGEKGGGEGPRTASGFFGIPVQGSRVVFIIDISRSMEWPYRRAGNRTSPGGRPKGRRTTKIAVAKEELLKAVRALPAKTKFNVIFFSQNVRVWRKKLTVASADNKQQLEKYLQSVTPQSSTNLWGGLQKGLDIKSHIYGDRYESHVDEVFVLSDGSPTAGDIINEGQILLAVTDTNQFSGVRINTVFIAGDDPGTRGGGRRGRPGGGGRGGPGRGGRGGGEAERMSAEELMKEIAKANHGKFVRPK